MSNYIIHPIEKIIELKKECKIPKNALFHFTKYIYTDRLDYNSRINFSVECDQVSISWLIKIFENLEPDWNLSFQSAITYPNGDKWFIPLIDFNVQRLDQEILEIIEFRLSNSPHLIKFESIIKNLTIYKSGRSYHGYGNQLLTHEEWYNFTLSTLFLNYTRHFNELDTIVDTRWVAHRLLEGYTCLRWSKNSKHYLEYPELVLEKLLVNNKKAG